MSKNVSVVYRSSVDLDKACEELKARLSNPLAVQRYLERQAKISLAWEMLAHARKRGRTR